MKSGERGGFGAALEAAHANPTHLNLVHVFCKADLENQRLLEKALPGIGEFVRQLYNWEKDHGIPWHLEQTFKGLRELDVESDDLYRVNLVTGEMPQ
jgi:hypothetical protein